LNSWYNLVHIVADDAKTDVFGVLFDDTAKCSLRRRGHHVCLIKYNEFEAFGEEGPGLCKLLDLLTDNIDASVVRGIQLLKLSTLTQPCAKSRSYLKDLFTKCGAVYSPCYGNDG
jgi:hypothetical protein